MILYENDNIEYRLKDLNIVCVNNVCKSRKKFQTIQVLTILFISECLYVATHNGL